MTTRSRYGLVMRAYPGQYRRDHGAELVDTADELADGRWSFRQARSLLAGGLRTRARLSTGDSPREAWGHGVATGLALWFVLAAVPNIAYLLGARGDISGMEPGPWVGLCFVGPSLAALSLTTRWPAALTVTVSSLVLVGLTLRDSGSAIDGFTVRSLFLATTALTTGNAVAWWLAVRTGGRRAMHPATTVGLVAVLVTWAYVIDAPFGPGLLVPLLGLPVVGLALAAIDPRPAIGAATLWFMIALVQLPVFAGEAWSERSIAMIAAVAFPAGFAAICGFVGRLGTRRLLTDSVRLRSDRS